MDRKERNKDLIKRMKKGETLSSFSSESSWFPPRPTIQKDKKAMDKLYNKKEPAENKSKLKGVENA